MGELMLESNNNFLKCPLLMLLMSTVRIQAWTDLDKQFFIENKMAHFWKSYLSQFLCRQLFGHKKTFLKSRNLTFLKLFVRWKKICSPVVVVVVDVCYAWMEVKERTIKPDLVLTKSPVNKMRTFPQFYFGLEGTRRKTFCATSADPLPILVLRNGVFPILILSIRRILLVFWAAVVA